ncbi:phytanoyl-CoA dioxygenase [Pleurocapsa sp. CCALA 161]|nr:phytanoyl-CoA dioxygenase [Pleurocapsa sp. CCALA 161]
MIQQLQNFLAPSFNSSSKDTVSKEIAEMTNEILDGQGYVMLSDLITTKEATEARQLVLDLAEQDRKEDKLIVQEKKERLYGLIYKADIFAKMAQNESLLSIVDAIIGKDAILGGFSAHILHPGAKSMGIHVDYPYWAMPAPFPKYPVLELQVIWLMEDFTANNGAPFFAAGTQNWASQPNKWQFKAIAKRITGKAGSAIISHGLCWHDTSDNNSDRPRVSLLGNYTPQYIHPLENNLFDYQPEAMENAPPRLKKLLRHNLMPKSKPTHGMRFMH